MTDVDKRIIDMQFNNVQFEKNISKSVKSLNKLQEGLNLEESAKSLSKLDRVGKKFSLESVSRNLDVMSRRFSTLGIIGVTALTNITNSAINSGKKMLSALTVKPILSGLEEYETKMNAITTILTNTRSKGTTLDQVNVALQELNDYADLTIYNFAEMTRNIGTFTAAGVGLQTSVNAIKGIANLAAGSGSTAQQASTAMYQLSQAIAAGSVKLQDWNSVVNAGMGGELFQNALRESAKELGIFVDAAAPFRETLRSGWLTSKVLTNTLEGFSTNQDLVDAATQVKTITQLYDVMQESVQSGWSVSWESIVGDKDQAVKTLTAISEGFNNLIGPPADARNAALKYWNEFGGREYIIQSLSNTFKGLMSVITPLNEAFREIFPKKTGSDLILLSYRIRDITERFKIGEETSKKLKTTFKGLFALVSIGSKLLKALFSGAFKLVGILPKFDTGLLDVTSSMGQFLIDLNESIDKTGIFGKSVDKVVGFIKNMGIVIGDTYKSIKDFTSSLVDLSSINIQTDFSFLAKMKDKLGGPAKVVGVILEKVGQAISVFKNAIVGLAKDGDIGAALDFLVKGVFSGALIGIAKKLMDLLDSGSGFVGGFTGILDGVKGSLEGYQKDLQANALLKISIAIGILATAMVALSMINPTKLTNAAVAIGILFADLFGSMALFDKLVTDKSMASLTLMTVGMIAMSVAVLILTTALIKLQNVSVEDAAKGVAVIIAMSATLVIAAQQMGKVSGKLVRSGVGMILFASAMIVMASAIKKIGELDTNVILKGLGGLTAIMAALVIFLKVSDIGKMGISAGIGIIALSAGLLILSEAVSRLGEIKTEVLVKGLAAVGALLLAVGLFSKIISKGGLIQAGLSMLVISGAMLILTKAIKQIGELDIEVIGKGLLGIAGVLIAIALAMKLMPKNSLVIGAGLLLMSVAIGKLAESIKAMGSMGWDVIGKGLLTLGGVLLILAVGVNAMTGSLAGAAALVIVSGALLMLVPVLLALGSMSLESIGLALLAMAGTFTVLGVASALLTPFIPSLIGLGAAIALLGIGALAAGAGLSLFAIGMSTLIAVGNAGAKAFVETVATLLRTLLKYAPDMVETGFKLLMSFLEGLLKALPKIVEVGIDIVVGIINALAEKLPDLIDAGFNLMTQFIVGLADAIDKNAPTVVKAIDKLFLALLKAAWLVLKNSYKNFKEIGGNFLEWLKKGILAGNDKVVESIKGLGDDMKEKLVKFKDDFFEIGSNLINGLINGIKNKASEVKDNMTTLASDALEAAKDFLGIASPSKEMIKIGEFMGDGMVEGIENSTPEVVDATVTMAKKSVEAAKKALDESKKWMDERKFYSQLSLQEELKAWEYIQQQYEEGTQERADADREVYNAKNNMTNQLTKLDEDYYANVTRLQNDWQRDFKAINAEYENAVKDRANTIYSTYGLFDKITEAEEKITGEDLITNLSDQVNQLTEWRSNLSQLYTKGVSDDLIKELQDLGPDSLDELKALNSLTEEELENYAELWKTKHKKANTQALEELKTMKKNVSEQIIELNKNSGIQLEELKKTWIDNTTAIKDETAGEMDKLIDIWAVKVEELKVNNKKSFKGMKDDIEEVDWEESGELIIDGVETGLNSRRHSLKNTMNTIAEDALKAMKDTLGIKSPSREFAKLGKFSMEGMIIGIKNYADKVSDASKNVGENALNSLSNTMSKIGDVINGNIDATPTIRPILDLTDVISKNKLLASTFNPGIGVNLTARQIIENITSGGDIAQLNSMEVLNSLIPKLLKSIENAGDVIYQNQFDVLAEVKEVADVKKVAKEIDNMQRQKGRAKGVTV